MKNIFTVLLLLFSVACFAQAGRNPFTSDGKKDTIAYPVIDSTGREISGYIVRDFGTWASGKPVLRLEYLDNKKKKLSKAKPKGL